MCNSKYHPAPEWEARRSEIRRLYIEEDQTLQQVMGIMSEKGFTATMKMYKTKLRQWNLFKNNRAADVAAILRSQSQRMAVGKGSIAVRNGRRVDTQTYMRRKGVSVDDLLQLAATSDLPGHLRCITPPPLSDPMAGVVFGSSPGRLGVKEVVGRWVLAECDKLGDLTGSGMIIDSGVDCESLTASGQDRPLLFYYESAASKIAAEYYDVIWLLQKSQSARGWTLANVVFSRLHMLLDNHEHLLYPILNLLMIILILPSDNTNQIHRALWDYLSSYAVIRFGPDHPTQRMLQQLTNLFEPPEETGGDGCEKYGLLHSILSDALSTLRSKMDDDDNGEQSAAECQSTNTNGSRQIYYDLVSLWYAESLRSHRGCRSDYGHPQLHLDEEDLLAALDDSSATYGTDGQRDPLSELGLKTVHSYLLLDLGHHTSWLDPSIYTHSLSLLNWKSQQAGFLPPDETEVNCLTAMALYHRAQCHEGRPISGADVDMMTESDHISTMQQHHDLARNFLQEAVWLDWELSGASIYNFEGLLLLQEWHAEVEDWTRWEVARQRSEACLNILFEEWGI